MFAEYACGAADGWPVSQTARPSRSCAAPHTVGSVGLFPAANAETGFDDVRLDELLGFLCGGLTKD
jgi:hypothetical protein